MTREIADRDFPDPWSCLLPEVLATLQGGDTQHMMGSLLMLRRVASCLEFASDARHKVMQVRWHAVCQTWSRLALR